MSHSLINRSADLKLLEDEGYEVEVRSGHLLLNHVPYVTKAGAIKYGILVSELSLAGDTTTTPSTHVVMFAGDMPCDSQGRPLTQIRHSSGRQELAEGLVVNYSFSSKPPEGYPDYYRKMTTYEAIISGPAQLIDASVTAQTFTVVEAQDEDSPFRYMDTASSRAGIGAITEKLRVGAVAIVGLGGTGSYILDLVAKTPVREIHLFDGDKLGQHNALRSPGAPSIETLRASPQKAAYYRDTYSEMRRNIVAHGHVDESVVDCLRAMNFVFIAVDKGRPRRLMVEKLEEFGVPFIDVGMGVEEVEGSLLGQLRVTASTDRSRDQVRSTLPFSDRDGDDDYSRNIQIADLNALNAALAVIKWKKLSAFYADLEKEHTTLYQIDGNHLVNEDRA